MSRARVVGVEFLADDLRQIRALFPDAADQGQDAVAALLIRALDLIASDKAAQQALEQEHDFAAQTAKQEIARKQASSLATAQRVQTIQKEMRVRDLRDQIQVLQQTYHEERVRLDLLRQSLTFLRRQIAQAQSRSGSLADALRRALAGLRSALTWLRGERHG